MENHSRAEQLLVRVDAEGNRVNAEGQPLASNDAAAARPMETWTFRVLKGRSLIILDYPSLVDGSSTPGFQIRPGETFGADAVHIDPNHGRAYLRIADGRGWVCERTRADFNRFAVEPLGEDDTKRRKKTCDGGGTKVLVVERGTTTTAKAAPTKAPRPLLLYQELVVLRSDSELWPKGLGGPRPITMEKRRALRRLAKYYGRRVRECSVDVRDVDARIKGFAVACQGKKQLETQADMLRKELAEVEKKWVALVEKEVSAVPPPATSVHHSSSAKACVAPVQVMGEDWHCATMLVEAGGEADWCLGPLRPDAAGAADDLHKMSEACDSRKRKGAPTGRK